MAGGSGSRLGPITKSISKHLLPVYDKPLIYYSLSVLFLAGVRNINIVCMQRDLLAYSTLLGNGDRFGANINYVIQDSPKGIAEGILLCKEHIHNSPIALMLGDNFFWGQSFNEQLSNAKDLASNGAHIFGYQVSNPSDFGVIELDSSGRVISLEEKPSIPKTNIAATGLYFYDNSAFDRARSLKPSPRGELEITDMNLTYLNDNMLSCTGLGRGFAWLDTGTTKGLHDASVFVSSIENRQGLKVACLEEIAFSKGWINSSDLEKSIEFLANSEYGLYLKNFLDKN